MHLAGEAYASDVFCLCLRRNEGFFDGRAARSPPVERILLSPAILWGSECLVFVSARGDNLSCCVNEQRSCAAGSYVDSQKK